MMPIQKDLPEGCDQSQETIARRVFLAHIDAMHGGVEAFARKYLRAHAQRPAGFPLNIAWGPVRTSYIRFIENGRIEEPK